MKNLHVSCGHGVTDNKPQPLVTTWADFSLSLATSQPVRLPGTVSDHRMDLELSKPAKLAQAYYIPGECHGSKKAANMDDMCLYVADLDGISFTDLEERLAAWEHLAYVVTSTWKHGLTPDEEGLRLRVVFPLARVADGSTWGATWQALTTTLGLKGLADEACKNADRLYFYPAHPVFDDGPAAEPFYRYHEGALLEPVTPQEAQRAEAQSQFVHLLGEHWPNLGNRHQARLALAGALYKTGVAEAEAERLVTEVNRAGGSDDDADAAAAVAATYQKDPEDVAGWGSLSAIVGDDIVHLARRYLGADPLDPLKLADLAATYSRKRIPSEKKLGEDLTTALAGGNLTPDAIRTLAEFLAAQYPAAAPDAISDVLKQSTDAARQIHGKAPDPAEVVTRERERERTQAQARTARANEERELRIRDAFGYDRTTGYTDDEIEAYRARLGRNPWVVQKGNSVFVLVDGRYRHYTQVDALAAMHTDLAPAHTAGVSLYTTNQNGDPVPKTLPDVVRDYGRVAQSVAYDLALQEPLFDETKRALRIPPCPLRELEPAYSERVQAWLDAFDDTRLTDWISVVTQLDKPCAALYLQGEGGAGKSLLARGLSRLWTTDGETDAEGITGSWNDALLDCPLTFADERLPDEWKIKQGTGKIRQFIQATQRNFNQKFHTAAKINGAIRLIIAANGDLFSFTNEDLTPGDIAAIGERFLQIKVTARPLIYLATVFGDGDKADRNRVHAAFIDGDEIARHALWLRDNHRFVSNGRFFFNAADSGVASTLNVMSGLRSNLCEWFCSYIKDPARLNQIGDVSVRIADGKVWANASAIVTHWETYSKQDVKRPQTNRVSSALTALAEDRRQHKGVNYRVIRTENLIEWATQTDYMTPEEIRDLLDKHSAKVDAQAKRV